MTVCMLIWDYWPGHEGGAQRQCRKLSHALQQQGIKIMVLTQRQTWLGRKRMDDHGIRIVRLGWLAPLVSVAMWMSQWKARWTFRENFDPRQNESRRRWGVTTPFWWLARFSFMRAAGRHILGECKDQDLIHVHESNWIAGFASWIGAKAGLPTVCKSANLPSLPVMGPDVPFRVKLTEWRLKQDFIVLNGEMAAELKAAGVDVVRIHLIPNGVAIPEEQAEPGNSKHVLHVAHFSKEGRMKSHDILLQAWSRVHRREPAARLVMVGGGDSRPWQAMAHDLGCENSVSFHGFSAGLDSHYRQAAAFVLPSRREGMSNALLEAQSWGIPAVVSDIPGNRAVIRHEMNGLVVPVDDAQELSEAILRLLKDPGVRAEMGTRSRQHMIAGYAIASIAAQVADLYANLLREPHRYFRRSSASHELGSNGER